MIDFSRCALIFDMDGTLVDNMRFHTAAWQRMLEENGIEARAEDFLVNTAGRTNREIVPEIFPGSAPEQVARLAMRKEEIYRELYSPHRRPVDGAVAFLEAARRAGFRLAVATAAPPENVGFILDGLDLRKYFETVTNSADVARGKPHPDLFLRTAETLGVVPSACIVFEDAINGFEAARRAGMRSVGIATVNPIEKITALPAVVAAYENFLDLDPQELVGARILESAVANT